MAGHDVVYRWENLPEYRCTQQLGRCIGRILVTLPRRYRPELGRVLIRGSIHIAQGIAGANAEMPPDDDLSQDDREKFRLGCLLSIAICRDALRLLLSQKAGSIPDLLVALELLERIDAGVRQRPLPHA